MAVVVRLTASTLADRMGIVETDEPFAIRAVKCQRVAEPVRSCSRNRHAPNDKLHPMTTRRIDDEHLPIQIEQRF